MRLTLTVFYFILATVLFSCNTTHQYRSTINLSGSWQFALDTSKTKSKPTDFFTTALPDVIQLPGTTDIAHKGLLNHDTTTMHLNCIYKYEGAAWYRKTVTIPADWKDKHVTLYLERTKPASVWVDDHYIGKSLLLESAQRYNLGQYLTPGTHTITIRVNNNLALTPYGNVHIYSDDTQTNWNGITGKIVLEASTKTHISDVQVYPDVEHRKFTISVAIADYKLLGTNATIELQVTKRLEGKSSFVGKQTYQIKPDSIQSLEYSLGDKTDLWDEYHRPIYSVNVILSDPKNNIHDNTQVDFGMRAFRTNGTQFTINNRPLFLRGKHDACVFPLTGHCPMDREGWIKVFNIAKTYGINHYRFHSWCPPSAAFEAADETGMYLQVELPFWGGLDADSIKQKLTTEGVALLKAYANHPSFVMFSPGNEIWSGHERIREMLKTFKAFDSRPLYTQGSNDNIGYFAPLEEEDYHVAARTPSSGDTTLTHTRLAQAFADSKEGGILNRYQPSARIAFNHAVSAIKIPLVSHEIGQYQIYPDYDEIKKYTGVLRPLNLEVFKKRLTKAGMLDQNKIFHEVTGKWSALCYRAEIEAALRTNKMAGFQLLDLQDFPGQGTALVGILDAFMESKQVITPEEWRMFCNDVVPMLVFDKYTWQSSETFDADVIVANYSNNILNQSVSWRITDDAKKVLAEGSFEKGDINNGGTHSAGRITWPLRSINKASKINIDIAVDGTSYHNQYAIWVYPDQAKESTEGVIVTDRLDAATLSQLNAGEKVLLFPQEKDVKANTVGGLFTPEFWNYGMFKGISEWVKKPISPGTLSILTDPKHPLFNSFPTDAHTNWQWWSIIKNSYPFILDHTDASYRPVVQVVDNLERNHKLGLIFEFKVGNGSLLICMTDLRVNNRPEVQALYQSIIRYMKSQNFSPVNVMNVGLIKLFGTLN